MINSTPELRQGCMEILESLLELPDELKVCPSANQEITFDLAMYENHGIGPDVLVICYPFVKDKFMGGSEGYGKGKQKAMVADQWSCEQRFILRPRE